MSWIALVLHGLAAAVLCAQGLNSYVLCRLHGKGRAAARERQARVADGAPATGDDAAWPTVTVQLPVFNERFVVERLLEAVTALDFPRDRLEVQVLDDSTDDTSERVAGLLPRLRAGGLAVEHRRREDRAGFKAGALAAGLRRSRGELVAVLDADFVPRPDFLRRAVPFFAADPRLGFVQCRWEHLNADGNALTRAEALAIDGHFGVEQGARAWSGLLLNFNGTAGVWRRAAIDAAGGWSGDTLTEDMDLSYRAQLAGWGAEYLEDVTVPAELPATLTAFKSQQRRWAKGSIQTARKLLPRVLRSGLPARVKLQAALHLTHYLVHPCMLLVVLTAPFVRPFWERAGTAWAVALSVALVALGSCGPTTLYVTACRGLRRPRRRLLALPTLMLVGTGVAVSNTRAVLEALLGVPSGFVRTPKRRLEGRQRARDGYRLPFDSHWLLEGLLAAWAAWGVVAHLAPGRWWPGPFLTLNALGLGLVAAVTAWEDLAGRLRRAGPQSGPQSGPRPGPRSDRSSGPRSGDTPGALRTSHGLGA